MENPEYSYITIFGQMGDRNADKAVGSHFVGLTKLLDQYCNRPYCRDVDQIVVAFRVDGDLWSFEFEGCEKLRLSKKNRYISIDVGMPRAKWENIEKKIIKTYVISNLRKALELSINRLKKEKYVVDEEKLWNDFKQVETKFLSP